MKSLRPLLYLSLLVSSCASNTSSLEQRMDNQEQRMAERQERYQIRSDSWDRRRQTMSDNADARYRASMDRLFDNDY